MKKENEGKFKGFKGIKMRKKENKRISKLKRYKTSQSKREELKIKEKMEDIMEDDSKVTKYFKTKKHTQKKGGGK